MRIKKGEKKILVYYEPGWRKPVQAMSIYKNRFGEVYTRNFFMEWDSFEEARECLKKSYSEYEIIIEKQLMLGLLK